MSAARKSTIKRLLLGLAAAVIFTVAAIAIAAALMIAVQISDKAITVFNQFVKIAAIVVGTIVAVPKGGEKGLASGAAIALIYTIAGYICYLALGGASFSFMGMLGEMLIGVAAGAVCGAVRANLNPKRKKRIKSPSSN